MARRSGAAGYLTSRLSALLLATARWRSGDAEAMQGLPAWFDSRPGLQRPLFDGAQQFATVRAPRQKTCSGRFVFSTGPRPLSENTMNKALRKMGYDTRTQHCGHGFRTTFSTLCNDELGPDQMPIWRPDVIELHLVSSSRRSLRSKYPYNRGLAGLRRERACRIYKERPPRDGRSKSSSTSVMQLPLIPSGEF
jgi:hypothetical protein